MKTLEVVASNFKGLNSPCSSAKTTQPPAGYKTNRGLSLQYCVVPLYNILLRAVLCKCRE